MTNLTDEEVDTSPKEIDDHESDDNMSDGNSDSDENMSDDDESDDNRLCNDDDDAEEVKIKASYSHPDEDNESTNNSKKSLLEEQKALIHTSLKRAKLYVTRTLVKRISQLRAAKGNEEQLAKNRRKVERMLKVMETLKQLLIDKLAERTIDIFQGTADSVYQDMWSATSHPDQVIKMISSYALMVSDEKYELIAYLRMLSCNGVHQKLRQISEAIEHSKLLDDPWKRSHRNEDELDDKTRLKIEKNQQKRKEKRKERFKEKKKEQIRAIRREKRKVNPKKKKTKIDVKHHQQTDTKTVETGNPDIIPNNDDTVDTNSGLLNEQYKEASSAQKSTVETTPNESKHVSETDDLNVRQSKLDFIKPAKRAASESTKPTKSSGSDTTKSVKRAENNSVKATKSTDVSNVDTIRKKKSSNQEVKTSIDTSKLNDNEGFDDFFMDNTVIAQNDGNSEHGVVDVGQNNEENSDGEEFTAPVTNEKLLNNHIVKKKKNRMGQRERKRRMLEEQTGGQRNNKFDNNNNKRRDWRKGDRQVHGRGGFNRNTRRDSRFSGDRNMNAKTSHVNKFQSKQQRHDVVKEEVRKVDETLHPSWQAKQRLKSQQGAVFSGTKIVFD